MRGWPKSAGLAGLVVAMGLMWFWPGLIQATGPEPVTSHPALDYFPAPSRDGRFLAFVSERTGNADIWLRSLAAGSVALPRQLTKHPAVDRDPSLNANGSRLLYVSHKTDPRGDIYVMDLLTGQETRVTDLSSGDSLPQWGEEENLIYYVKLNPQSGSQSVMRRSLSDGQEQVVAKDATTFFVAPNGAVVFSREGRLHVIPAGGADETLPLTSESVVDVSPVLTNDGYLLFARYQEDSNRDGGISTDDQSSIWLGKLDQEGRQLASLYRMTPTGNFHVYPVETQGRVYFADLKKGDIFHLSIEDFLDDYSSFERAYERATFHLDRGEIDLGLLGLTNISRNLAPELLITQRAEFDFAYVEQLVAAGHLRVAEQVLRRYQGESGTIGALAQLQAIVLTLHQQADRVSTAKLTRLIHEKTAEMMAIGEANRTQETVYGQALIEAGRAYLLVDDFLSALDYLVKVDELTDNEIKAKALFTRGTVYRGLGDEAGLRQVFVDVIAIFGEDSSWGRRAVTQAIAVSEKGKDVHQQVASLQGLIEAYPDLPLLRGSTSLRIAELYEAQGEQVKAIAALDRMLSQPPPFPEIVEQGLRRKAEILAAAERYEEAAETYAELVERTGGDQEALDRVQRLMVLQLVRKGVKDRAIGEVRIAAKEFAHIAQTYPDSVEAHREYITTKAMLKEAAEVEARYRDRVKQFPDDAIAWYGWGLALSYLEPPDFPRVIDAIEQAIELNPGISYFHQTLGWAFEQEERIQGKTGFLEKAEQEYRIALNLNDGFQFPDVESNLLLNLGNVYLALGNYREAYRHYQQRGQFHVVKGDSVTELLFLKNFGEAAFKAGHSEESIQHYQAALKRVPEDQPHLKAELLERIGLSHQDLGQFSEAVHSFSEAMQLNLAVGNRKNLALLQRNIGVNLYNLSTAGNGAARVPLKQALENYFASLEAIREFGGKQRQKGAGLINVEVPLGVGGSEAAAGFDPVGEEKLMFSYIAGTYEKLGESDPARDYYLKKLDLIDATPDAETNVARLTEKAVVLNRIGRLSHQLGLRDEAIDYMRQSLGYTQALDLDFGTRVNVYNLSRLSVERMLEGEEVDWSILETMVAVLDTRLANEANDPQTFFALTNTAFLLSVLPGSLPGPTGQLEDDVARLHSAYDLASRVWPYYSQARRMLQENDVLPEASRTSMLLVLDLNMRELALHSQQQETLNQLNTALTDLTARTEAWNRWLWSLSQAENATEPTEREVLLQRALEELMRYPPNVAPRSEIRPVLPFLDRLRALSVDHLVGQGQYERALMVAEQVTMRKMSLALYEAAGEDLFFKGIGDYTEDLRSLITEVRQALSQERWEDAKGLSIELEEILFALYEEYPWAASYFWQYPLSPETLSHVFSPEHPFIHVIPGIGRVHAFIHDGEAVQYVPVNGNREALRTKLNPDASVYLAIPETLADHLDEILPPVNSVTRLSSSYDALNGFHQRSVLYADIGVAGTLSLPSGLTAGNVPLSVQAFNGTADHDGQIIKSMDVLIAATGRAGLSFPVKEQLRVRELVHVLDLAGLPHHSALILNPGDESNLPIPVMVQALLRARFPHVIVNQGPRNDRGAEQFAALYLTLLEDLPPHEAVAEAANSLDVPEKNRPRFVLYGYAGMNEEEKTDFAVTIYEEQLNQAVALYKEQRYPEALHHIEHALSVIYYAGRENDLNELTKLAVDASYQTGDYSTAVFYQKQLLDGLGDSAPIEEQSEALYQLGILYSRLEQFDLAIDHLNRAIELWTQADELDRLAEGIATLGVVRENMGAYSEALQDFGRSYALYEEIGEIGDVATQHRRIGRIYYLRLGRYEQARKEFEAALDAFRELEDRRGEAETLYEIGLTYEKMGLFEKADSFYQQGHRIGEALNDPFLLASGDLYFANTAWFRGRYQDAFQSLSRAEKSAQAAGDTQLTIMAKNTRGLMYWTLNETDKGLMHLQQAVALAKEADIPTELASSLNNLGLIYRQQGDYLTSLEYFEQAKAIDEALNSRWGLGYDYRNIGMSQLKLGQVAEAEANFIKAEQVSAEIKNAINWVKALLELGNVNRTLARPDKAVGYYTQAFERSRQYGIQEVEWRAAKGKAGILWEQGQKQEAFTWYADAVTVVEGMRASLKIDELRNSFQANKQDLYREVIRLLIEMGRMDEAFNYLERSRSRSFIDLLGNQKLTLKNEADQEALDAISQLSRQVDALRSEVGSYDDPPAELVAEYETAKTRYDEALLNLKQQNPGLSSFVAVDPLTLEDVKQLLDPGVALLSFLLTPEGSYAWVIQRTGMVFQELPVKEEAVVKMVTQYRQLVQHVEPVDEELTALYANLIAPVRSRLEGVEYLGIIPDGPLHFLSFSALKNSQKRYLVEEFPLFYTPSASVLKFTFAKRQENRSRKVLAVGNPDLGNFNYDLPLAELEAKSIKWNYPDMDILTREKATKEWFIEHINEYGVIHLAAHGEFDEFNPLFSSLWLASESPSNRRLTVKEVFGLEIKADLVTLSACQTGLGKLEAGELIGLNRAFIYAGTHALVSALWRVDDLSTSVLMKHFYRNYVTMDKAKSLRQAQLLIKRDFPHPSYWAGFSLVGDYQ